MTNWKQ